jgi:hypothetical protein
MKRKKKQTRVQIELPIDEKRLRGSPQWMLIFKPSDRVQPLIELGTLDTVYEQFTRFREQFAEFLYAAIYSPSGRIHRHWGKQKPKL